MMKLRTAALVGVLVLVVASAAQAGTVSMSDLYPTSGTPTDYPMVSGQTQFVFFEAQQTVILNSISVFGEPVVVTSASDFRFQLFHTDSNWDTPNGNGDRLFHEQVFFTDIGSGTYTVQTDHFFGTPAVITLKEGERYRLSFQISNCELNLPQYLFPNPSTPYLTDDARFTVSGAGGFWGYPKFDNLQSYTLGTTTVPLPSAVWLGLGLLGLIGAARRMRKRTA